VQLIAAAGSASLVVATLGFAGSGPSRYLLLVSADGGMRWAAAVAGSRQITPGVPGSAFLVFADSSVGRWISSPNLFWITFDGGLHWFSRPFP
jgi:photosystem II stability/assembly factor-like uncharacterized protein